MKTAESELFKHYNQDLTEELNLTLKSSDVEVLKTFEEYFKDFTSKLHSKLSLQSAKLSNLCSSITSLKLASESRLQVSQQIKAFEEKFINHHSSEPAKAAHSIILNLYSQLILAKREIISPLVEVIVKSSDTGNTEQVMENDYEQLVLANLQLKSDILSNEGELTELRKLKESVRDLQEKCDLLDKVNKELASKKNEESDDSLDLDCGNIKDMIEIQELRAALRSISERYEQEKETLLRDCSESRQDIETQMFRLKNEKAYIEVKCKDSEKALIEINREKERLEGVIVSLKKDIDRIKDSKYPIEARRSSLSKHGSSDSIISRSHDFDLTESIENFANPNINDVYQLLQEELNELALKIHQNQLVSINVDSSKATIENLVDSCIRIKNTILSELPPNTKIREIPESLAEIFTRFKKKIGILEQELSEREKKIEELMRNDRLEVQTEPSPRMSGPSASMESSYIIKRQLQAEKLKLSEKKNEIHRHKEQIAVLKQNVRDLQSDLEKVSKLDIQHLQLCLVNLVKEVPILNKSAEDSIEVLMRMAGIAQKDAIALINERKTKKGKLKFGLFS